MTKQSSRKSNQPRNTVRSAVINDGTPPAERAPRFNQAIVLSAYARWAPVYDFVFARLVFFGSLFDRGRELAIDHINTRTGKVLEVGVGTGVSLGRYAPHLAVTGIDLSPDMLALARQRTLKYHLSHVHDLQEMDAGDLKFETASFETVVIMYTITVVPHPQTVLDEVVRVLKPGGEAVFVSHFAANEGWRGRIEKMLVPITRHLGWRPDFPVSLILNHPELEHVETRKLPPLGVFSIVRLRKRHLTQQF
jgi:phosphatidylethanolamine/phosphatidyl-N-methylethanolamine N-methyltransferase